MFVKVVFCYIDLHSTNDFSYCFSKTSPLLPYVLKHLVCMSLAVEGIMFWVYLSWLVIKFVSMVSDKLLGRISPNLRLELHCVQFVKPTDCCGGVPMMPACSVVLVIDFNFS